MNKICFLEGQKPWCCTKRTALLIRSSEDLREQSIDSLNFVKICGGEDLFFKEGSCMFCQLVMVALTDDLLTKLVDVLFMSSADESNGLPIKRSIGVSCIGG